MSFCDIPMISSAGIHKQLCSFNISPSSETFLRMITRFHPIYSLFSQKFFSKNVKPCQHLTLPPKFNYLKQLAQTPILSAPTPFKLIQLQLDICASKRGSSMQTESMNDDNIDTFSIDFISVDPGFSPPPTPLSVSFCQHMSAFEFPPPKCSNVLKGNNQLSSATGCSTGTEKTKRLLLSTQSIQYSKIGGEISLMPGHFDKRVTKVSNELPKFSLIRFFLTFKFQRI